MIRKYLIAFLLNVILILCFHSKMYGQYQLNTAFGDTLTCSYRTGGIFVVWWDAKYDGIDTNHYEDAGIIIDSLQAVRALCLNELGMQDPNNPAQGYYFNIYIHHGSEDLFPVEWGNGVGHDTFRRPYLTLPWGGYHLEPRNLNHEGFHIFQTNWNGSGFKPKGDSGWYWEATANWFSARRLPGDEDSFLVSETISSNPQVPMWRGWYNAELSQPNNWQRQNHQYAMNNFLYYLTEVAGVQTSVICKGFYAYTYLLPQEYLFEKIGAVPFRKYFADWTAHNVTGFDYISLEQWERAQLEFDAYGDPTDVHDIVQTFTDEGTGGEWFTPSVDYVTRGWSYNVYRMENNITETYTFHLEGDEFGSENGDARFEGRVVVGNGTTFTYYDLEMKQEGRMEGKIGSKTISVNSDDNEIYFVVAATPNHFSGNQKYSYRIKIDKGMTYVNVVSDNILSNTALLRQNYPNPFNPITIINFELPYESDVEMKIYDITGRLIFNWDIGIKEAGSHSIQWNGSDLTGNKVNGGIYFYKFQAGDFVQTKKMVLLK